MSHKYLIQVLATFCLLVKSSEAALASKLQEKYSWRVLDYAYPDDRTRQHAISSGAFVPENNLPVGIEVWNDKIFVTVPRWRSGIPSTLNYLSANSFTGTPKLSPYPDWSTNREGNCAGLTTTYRIKVDECDRLWVLDSGTVGIGNTTEQVCPVALHIFDLTTDQEIRRYQYKPEDTNDRTFIANIAVDIGASCDDAYAYVSDELGYGLIVYSLKDNDSWRITHPFFMPDPLVGDYNIAGLNFQWGEEGIFGMSLSPIKSDGFRTLFFHPLSSNREFAVSTSVLRDKARALDEKSYHEYQVLEERGPLAHSTAEVQTDDGIMFYSLVDHNAIGCWNSRNPYKPQYQDVIDRDDVGLVFPSDVKVDRKNNLWVISDRMPVFLIANLDYNDVNFRIYTLPVADAVRGTACDFQPGQGQTSRISIRPLMPIPPELQTINPQLLDLPKRPASGLPYSQELSRTAVATPLYQSSLPSNSISTLVYGNRISGVAFKPEFLPRGLTI